MASERDLIQYYIAERGQLGDGALALLAARGALLGHQRWRTQAAYARWHSLVMTKVVLAGTAAELARVRAEVAGTLALASNGQEAVGATAPALLVLPPQPRADSGPTVAGLRLAPKQRGPTPEPTGEPVAVLIAADDLGMHGGKLAAQCAHAVLLGQVAYHGLPVWAAWRAADYPLALRQADSAALAALAARFPGGAVHDAGHTQVAAGSLTVVLLPPGSPTGLRVLVDWPAW